jgi:hypothetical protein
MFYLAGVRYSRATKILSPPLQLAEYIWDLSFKTKELPQTDDFFIKRVLVFGLGRTEIETNFYLQIEQW